MEPQEQNYYCCNKCCKRRNCLGIVAIILAIALSFTVGLLVGAALALIVLIALPAIIVLAVILALLLILTIILMIFMTYDLTISALAADRQSERIENIPPSNKLEKYLDKRYPDEYMDKIFNNRKYV